MNEAILTYRRAFDKGRVCGPGGSGVRASHTMGLAMHVFSDIESSRRAESASVPSCETVRAARAEARKRLLAQRKALSAEDRLRLSERIQAFVLADSRWRAARAVALYVAVRREVSTDRLIEAAWAEGKTVLLPRCLPRDPADPPTMGGRMDFVACRCREELEPGSFGILEPCPGCRVIAPGRPDDLPELAVIPLVGLRADGARLGYGGGYYDRAFSRPGWIEIPRLALAYSFQMTSFPGPGGEEETRGLGDVFMTGYVTEEGLTWL